MQKTASGFLLPFYRETYRNRNIKVMSHKDFQKGFICDCCGQYVKAYSRKLNTSMALVLILMFRSGKKGYWHIEKWLKEIGRPELRADYHKLRFWGLIEAKTGEREDGSKRNGYYKITGRGMLFAEGKSTVQEKAIIFNNKFQSFEGEEITIHQSLKNRFNYNELMGKLNPKTDKELKEAKALQLF
jgi:hypothetical protein